MTLEGESPRHGQPPRGRRKRVEKAVAKLLPFPLFRDHAVGRSPSAMGWLLHSWARHPSHVHEPACPTRVCALPLLRLLGTPAQVIRLTTDSHMPAERIFCMGRAKPHRCRPSARYHRAGDTHGGGDTVATSPNMYLRAQKNRPRGVVVALRMDGSTTPTGGVFSRYVAVTVLPLP